MIYRNVLKNCLRDGRISTKKKLKKPIKKQLRKTKKERFRIIINSKIAFVLMDYWTN